MGRLRVEMKSRMLFSIEPNKQSRLSNKNQFGNEVTIAFPSTIVDIEEASRCLAFERYTASVFHLMRTMEVGLKVIGKYLNIPELSDTSNKSWESILRSCEEYLKKPEWKNNQFVAGAVAMLHSVKDAWRNPTMHAERTYTEEQAKDIWNAVKGFMRHLSTQLQE